MMVIKSWVTLSLSVIYFCMKISSVKADSSDSSAMIIYILGGVAVVLFIVAAIFVCNRKSPPPQRLSDLPTQPITTTPSHSRIQYNPSNSDSSIGQHNGRVIQGNINSNDSLQYNNNYQVNPSKPSQYNNNYRPKQQQLDISNFQIQVPVPPSQPHPMSQQNMNQYQHQHQHQQQHQYQHQHPIQPPQQPYIPARPIQPPVPPHPTNVNPKSNAPKDAPLVGRPKEVAERVLAEFQAHPQLSRQRINYNSIYFTRVLSKGAFGEVWLAQLENRQVAVKRILSEKKSDEKEIECFGAEVKLMALFNHPKIVEFIGVSWSVTHDICAVTEYMQKGDLYGFLKKKTGQLNWKDHKIFLAEDVADALLYLHSLSPKVIHRDLKSKNILLDDAFRAKLSDFGIARERTMEETMTAGVGTIYWTAPEVLMGKKYTEKADIYSFGIVMSELDTQAVPYSDKRDNQGKRLQGMKIIQQVIRKNLRPTFDANCPYKVKELAIRCLDASPDVRPDAAELLDLILKLEDDF